MIGQIRRVIMSQPVSENGQGINFYNTPLGEAIGRGIATGSFSALSAWVFSHEDPWILFKAVSVTSTVMWLAFKLFNEIGSNLTIIGSAIGAVGTAFTLSCKANHPSFLTILSSTAGSTIVGARIVLGLGRLAEEE
jgi:hypothetical protein